MGRASGVTVHRAIYWDFLLRAHLGPTPPLPCLSIAFSRSHLPDASSRNARPLLSVRIAQRAAMCGNRAFLPT
jgi:hypothetical protein